MDDGRDPRFSDETKAFSHFMKYEFPRATGFTVDDMRKRSEDQHEEINKKFIGSFKGKEEYKTVKISGNTEIPITIYTPVAVNKDKMVIFFHGGGLVVNSRKTHQTIVNMFADATKYIWISVEYRRAPEYKFPVWLDDATEVTKQILANKTVYGGDENTKVGVVGDSGGGLFAASMCHTIKGLAFQIPICVQFEFLDDLPSRNEFNDAMYVITKNTVTWFLSKGLPNDNDKKDSRISLLRKKSFDSLPPCLFIVAELDMFHDDSFLYQEALDKAGVKTKLVEIKGAIHPFISFPGIFTKSCQQAIDAVKEFLADL